MQAKTLMTLLASLVVGVVIGYLVQGWMRQGTITLEDPAPIVNQAPAAPKEYTADQLKGFCCAAKGQQCQASASDVECLGAGGYVFAYTIGDCNNVCVSSAP